MNNINQLLLASLLTVSSFTAQAEVKISDAWVRATVPQQKATGAFMQLTSTQDTHLVEIRSSAASMAQLHKMEMVDNVMRMREADGLNLTANKAVELKPGGYHIMLMGLNAQAKVGDVIPLTLVFENKDKKRETLMVNATVKPLTQMGTPSAMPEHQH
ncbi:copper chaperone PCu(A)C [Undibacterium sp. RuRC25W]|uniref:copper chaperone PCu(A)C n=1 Tax=Undibacterium sp. RuRC25W TaxID=3413047 RepID=UPI003BEFAC5A